MKGKKTALLAGGSGLVGGHCLRYLLADERYKKVISIGRRTLDLEHPRLEQRVVDFRHLPLALRDARADDVFCCLGTTIADAGSREAFREVDYTFVVSLGQVMHHHGAQQMLVVSSMGADPGSLFFYPRVKGEAETALRALDWPSLHLFRPASLTGQRDGFRLGEAISIPLLKLLSPAMVGPLTDYRPIAARTVARAMHVAAERAAPGAHVYPSDTIKQMVK